jgi:hypothetical protein
VAVNTNAPGTLVIEFSETGFTGNIGNPFQLLMTTGGTLAAGGNSFTYKAYIDPTNTLFGQGQLLTSFGFASSPFMGEQIGNAQALAGPYSLTQVVTIVHNTSGSFSTSSFGATLSAVPEPTSVILLGSGLAAIGFARRKQA